MGAPAEKLEPPAPPAEAKKRKIVVADDRPENRMLFRRVLSEVGLDVYCAKDGPEALGLIESQSPDLVLLDFNMPGLNGLETLNSLRQKEIYTPVIFVSGASEKDVVVDCLRSGADDFIRKPFSIEEMVERVKVRLRLKELHDALSAANQKLKETAERDELTGLYNMRHIFSKIDFELKRARRYSRLMACVMMDLDHFKSINDEYDHLFGNFVIKEMGKIIQVNIREVDLAARYGGDEFLIVLTEITPDGAQKFGERLLNYIRDYEFNDGNHSVRRSASLGYAVAEPGCTFTAEELVRKADEALYESKRAGRNRVMGHNYNK